MRRLLITGAAFAMACLCPAQEIRRAEPAVAAATVFNDEAKFLAGIPLPETSPLASLQRSTDYREHSKAFEKLWMRYAELYFYPMREWSSRELSPRISPALPVLYFFGGPDALAVQAFYPDASDYVLGGLEPVGSLPPPATIDPVSLSNLRKSTEVILSYGHFITKDMKSELEGSALKGVLPIFLTFCAMSGAEVLDVAFFGIGPGGEHKEYALDASVPKGMLPGVRITFRRDPVSPARRLYYVQANVADDVLSQRSDILNWAAGFGPSNVYLKAASYLMHEPYFSKIRGFLLSNGQSVLQDDSGIPLKYFRTGDWRLWFFGTYNGTLDIFKKYLQPELADAFRQPSGPLIFGTGYKWRRGESNLMLAVKQLQPPRAEPVSVPLQ